GSNAKPTYGNSQELEAGGQPIEVCHHGDSQPVAADWDGDGLLDLIVGWGDGSVVWYRNLGSRTEPKLAKGINRRVGGPQMSQCQQKISSATGLTRAGLKAILNGAR